MELLSGSFNIPTFFVVSCLQQLIRIGMIEFESPFTTYSDQIGFFHFFIFLCRVFLDPLNQQFQGYLVFWWRAVQTTLPTNWAEVHSWWGRKEYHGIPLCLWDLALHIRLTHSCLENRGGGRAEEGKEHSHILPSALNISKDFIFLVNSSREGQPNQTQSLLLGVTMVTREKTDFLFSAL